jgi:hypothetical protein
MHAFVTHKMHLQHHLYFMPWGELKQLREAMFQSSHCLSSTSSSEQVLGYQEDYLGDEKDGSSTEVLE